MNRYYVLCCLLIVFVFTSCGEDEPAPATVNFTSTTAGISSSESTAEIPVTFSRAVTSGGELHLTITSTDLVYGESGDFYTNPAAQNDVITLPYQQGAEYVTFQVISGTGLNIQEDKQIEIAITDVGNALITGTNERITVNFSENFIAPSGILEFNGGGEDFTLQSYVDLSKGSQSTAEKSSWDLGFYNESGEFRVILNSPAATMARPMETNDLSLVTPEDTLGFAYEMTVPPPNFDPSIGSVAWIDAPDGDLDKTAIAAVSSTDSENMVYILKRPGKDWKKIRIVQAGDGYEIQYADISATSFETLAVSKNADHSFTYVDLDDGIVTVAPAKQSWDLMYSTYTEILPLGPTDAIPYSFKDYITINRAGTKVAMVMIADIAYETFSSGDVAGLEFSTDVNAIGSSWRSGGGPNSGPALYDDRYFVIQDTQGNTYKLLFTRLTSTSGERGYPEFTYERVTE